MLSSQYLRQRQRRDAATLRVLPSVAVEDWDQARANPRRARTWKLKVRRLEDFFAVANY